MLIGLHGWLLVLKLPYTIWAVFRSFRPGGFGIPDKDFWAFGSSDAGFRPWYNKIARDYHSQGRFGYVWDDGLGMSLGARIYNNLATYKLLYWFGTRRMMALGYLLMILTTILVTNWGFGLWIGLLVGILVAGSPLIVGAYTHLGKPDVFWWSLAIPVTFAVFSGNALLAGLLWSAAAWLSLSVSVMLILLLGLVLLVTMALPGDLSALLLGFTPGMVKHGIRGFYMWRAGFMISLKSEQSRLWKRPLYPAIDELLMWFPFGLSVLVSAYLSKDMLVGGLIVFAGIGLYWANFRIIYFSDAQSFHLAFWVIGLCYVVKTESLTGLLLMLLLVYSRARTCGIPICEDECSDATDPWQRRLYNSWKIMQNYPSLVPALIPKPNELINFFMNIPDGSRVIAESDGDPRTASKFRNFWQWSEEILPFRQVDLVNEIYTHGVEPELVDRYLTRFNAEQMTSQEMGEVCKVLGVSYVVVHTITTMESLKGAGYHYVAHIDMSPLTHFRQIVHTPPVTLSLLRNPSAVAVIEPASHWVRRGNELIWEAKAGQIYMIRYRFHSEFKAQQQGKMLAVKPVQPIGELPLRFMQVKAIADGPLILKLHPRWF